MAEDSRAAGGEATTFTADMLVEDEVKVLFGHAVETFGSRDILINNAGSRAMLAPRLP